MQQAEKLLMMAGLGTELYGQQRMGKIVSSVAVVAVLAIVAAVLLGAATLLGMYAGYLTLVAEGITPAAAMALMALAALAITGLLLLAVRRYVNRIKAVQRSPITDVFDAFLDGLFERKASI